MNLFQSREFKPESCVYIITFFRLSMTKCLLVKWRHYALNAHQLCVLISVCLIALLCLHISKATGLTSPRGRPGFVRVTAARPEDGEE